MAKQKLPPTRALKAKGRSSQLTPAKPREVEGGKQWRGALQYTPGDWSPRRDNRSSQKPMPAYTIQQTPSGENFRKAAPRRKPF